MSGVICGDNRFEIIEKAKRALLDSTNINTSPDEMKVLDSILFRAWQMGWLNKYDEHLKNTMTLNDYQTQAMTTCTDTLKAERTMNDTVKKVVRMLHKSAGLAPPHRKEQPRLRAIPKPCACSP